MEFRQVQCQSVDLVPSFNSVSTLYALLFVSAKEHCKIMRYFDCRH